jgi:hypothetical protein
MRFWTFSIKSFSTCGLIVIGKAFLDRGKATPLNATALISINNHSLSSTIPSWASHIKRYFIVN